MDEERLMQEQAEKRKEVWCRDLVTYFTEYGFHIDALGLESVPRLIEEIKDREVGRIKEILLALHPDTALDYLTPSQDDTEFAKGHKRGWNEACEACAAVIEADIDGMDHEQVSRYPDPELCREQKK
jgi:hypothetical protein